MDVDVKESTLTDLLYQAQNLVAEFDGPAEMPRVLRSITQMVHEGNQLVNKTAEGAPSREQADVQAAILLGSRGFDLPKLSQKIDALSAGQSYGPIEQIPPTDIEGFLRNERQNTLLAVVTNVDKTTQSDIESFVWTTQKQRWEQEKQKVMSSIELMAQQNQEKRLNSMNESLLNWSHNTSASLLSPANMTRRDQSILSGVPCRVQLNSEELKYSKALGDYNQTLISGDLIDVNPVERLGDAVKQLDNKDVSELWSLLIDLTAGPKMSGTHEDRRAIIDRARRYLEKKHIRDIRGVVYGNLNKAALGGVPGTIPMIRGYLNIKPAYGGVDNVTVEGHPFWAMLYHCLRCGDFQAAHDVCMKGNMPDIAGKLQECQRSVDRKLNEHSAMELKLRYMRECSSGGDPFKRLVMSVLAGCDVNNDHQDVAKSIEDYIWLKLSKLQRPDQVITNDSLTLERLQNLISEEYGEAHFEAMNKPLNYAYILLLTIQFEQAIDFLFRTDALKCHAVHIAIALNELGWLNINPDPQSKLLIKDKGQSSINLARLITGYTLRFETKEPAMALEYYYHIREKHAILYNQIVAELVLETKSFDTLIGKRDKDGAIIQGALHKFFTDTGPIVEVIAEASEARGMNLEAVSLYDLIGRNDKCIRLLNRLLCQLVPQAGPPGSKRDILHKMAAGIASRFAISQNAPSDREKRTLSLLLDLVTFFDLYHKKSDNAIDCVRQLDIVPLSPDEVDGMVQTFNGQGEEIRRILPDILLALMTILCEQYRSLKASGGSSSFMNMILGGSDKKLELIKLQANALIKYAGMIPYRLPGSTNAKLIQMEANMA